MVSVLIPVYNAKETLPECVNSIICQTYSDFEIIMIDDGSTDGSGDLCDELARKYTADGNKVRVIHQKNGGVSAARNRGMEAAEGKYFVCVDSDDTVTETYLQDMIELQEGSGEFGHVCCGFVSLLQSGKEYVFSDREPVSVSDRRDYMELSEKIMVQSPCLRLYRTDVVKNNKLRMREDINLGEDLLFNLEYFDAVRNTKFGIVNRANYIYHDENDASLNHKYRANLCEIYDLIHSEIRKYLVKWDAFDENAQKKYFNYVYGDYLKVLNNTYNAKNSLSVFRKLKLNNRILKSEGFREALKKCTVCKRKILKAAFSSGHYSLVVLAKKICRVLNHFGR